MGSPGQVSGRKAGRVDLRRRAVEIGRGVRMSCQELGDNLAVIRFLCPSPRARKRRESPKI